VRRSLAGPCDYGDDGCSRSCGGALWLWEDSLLVFARHVRYNNYSTVDCLMLDSTGMRMRHVHMDEDESGHSSSIWYVSTNTIIGHQRPDIPGHFAIHAPFILMMGS
jgi:hypothetical protein